jgi:hypothetical protein
MGWVSRGVSRICVPVDLFVHALTWPSQRDGLHRIHTYRAELFYHAHFASKDQGGFLCEEYVDVNAFEPDNCLRRLQSKTKSRT